MKLFKAFDSLDHSLLIATLEAYSFDSLSIPRTYEKLPNNQKTEMESWKLF